MDDYHDYWAPLQPGDIDPCAVPNERCWCDERSPMDEWYCSRTPGHPGFHVASDGCKVLEVWGDPLPHEMVLPEGF